MKLPTPTLPIHKAELLKLLSALLLVGLLSISSCVDANQQEVAAFCTPVLARVDTFMASFEGRVWNEERYGGTAVVAGVADLRGGMNGFDGSDVGASHHQRFAFFMTLIQYDEDINPIPYLAESWEVSEDQTELTFHLRDDVLWHDGTPTTAHDVEFTFLRASDPATNFANASFFQYYRPGNEGVEVLDSLTVRFHLAQPHMDFMDPWRNVVILPRHLLAEVPPGDLARHPFGTICPVGNGPFQFDSYEPGSQWVFRANPAFPEELGGRPYLDRYIFRVIPEAPTLLAELQVGNVDVYIALLPHYAPQVRGDSLIRVVAFQNRNVFFAAWNARNPKLSDARVRTAMTLATHRQRILEGIRGDLGYVVNTGVPPTHWAYDPSLSEYFGHDPDQARELLSQAGWEDRDGDGVRENAEGTPLSIELLYNLNQERQEVAEIMQAQLREVGVDLQPRGIDYVTLVNTITAPERPYEGFLISWEAEFRLDERDLFHSEAAEGPMAFSGIHDPVLDRYLDTLQLITDRDLARPLWREYQLRQMELHPNTYLYAPHRQNGVRARLQGVVMDQRGDWRNMREWWISPEDRKTP